MNLKNNKKNTDRKKETTKEKKKNRTGCSSSPGRTNQKE
jgi:hypothetical protein